MQSDDVAEGRCRTTARESASVVLQPTAGAGAAWFCLLVCLSVLSVVCPSVCLRACVRPRWRDGCSSFRTIGCRKWRSSNRSRSTTQVVSLLFDTFLHKSFLRVVCVCVCSRQKLLNRACFLSIRSLVLVYILFFSRQHIVTFMTSEVLLFVIDRQTRSLASMIEVSEYITSGRNVVLVS